MVENQRNLRHFPYLDNANFQPSKMELVLVIFDHPRNRPRKFKFRPTLLLKYFVQLFLQLGLLEDKRINQITYTGFLLEICTVSLQSKTVKRPDENQPGPVR